MSPNNSANSQSLTQFILVFFLWTPSWAHKCTWFYSTPHFFFISSTLSSLIISLWTAPQNLGDICDGLSGPLRLISLCNIRAICLLSDSNLGFRFLCFAMINPLISNFARHFNHAIYGKHVEDDCPTIHPNLRQTILFEMFIRPVTIMGTTQFTFQLRLLDW